MTYISRWTPPVASSMAEAIPVKASKAGSDSKDHTYMTEVVAGTPDGTSVYWFC